MTATNYYLFVGALKAGKNVSTLLEAFGEFHRLPRDARNDKDINLLIVGGDKWKDKEIDNVYGQLPKRVQHKIHFLGVVSDEALARLYKNAIAFVSPSVSEGFGLTFLEAMSFGTPVIGSNTGSISEVVGNAGILIDPASTKEIAKAMEKMLDSKMRLTFSKKAKIQSQTFSWEKFAQKFLDLLYFLKQ